MKKATKVSLLLIFFVLVSYSSYEAGFYAGENSTLKLPPPEIKNAQDSTLQGVDFSIFWEAWRRASEKYIDKEKLNPQDMVYGAIRGMIESFGDPYTTFFTPQETKEFNEELSGEYQGVGMMVGIKNEQLTVISPLKKSPAEKVGLRAGDKILKIDDTPTADISIEKAVSLIRGPAGTKVKLLIQRKGWKEPREFEIERARIEIPTVEWELKDNEIALIKIYQFNGILSSKFKKVAGEILKSPAKRIILDLRNNPGGYLETAQEIAGWFLEKGEVVVTQESQDKNENKKYKSKGPSVFSKYPTVVLINQGSASAAEILAGALRDNRQVKLIGEKSFGKGSVQEQIFLSDNSSIKVTIARWLTPKGISIEEKGLEPDIEVEMEEEDFEEGRDTQLEKAIEVVESL